VRSNKASFYGPERKGSGHGGITVTVIQGGLIPVIQSQIERGNYGGNKEAGTRIEILNQYEIYSRR
jgi:hypothetical protein